MDWKGELVISYLEKYILSQYSQNYHKPFVLDPVLKQVHKVILLQL